MGNTQTKIDPTEIPEVFVEPLKNLNTCLSTIINKENKFIDTNYSFVNENECQQYTMVLESSLKKMFRVHLTEAHESIFVIPNKDSLSVPIHHNTAYIAKSQLCETISNHYKKILDILVTVKEVYDIESKGQMSLGGITLRNIRMLKKNSMEINYCATSQFNNLEPGINNPGTVPLSQLKGIDSFTQRLLTKTEKKIFMKQFQMVLQKQNKAIIALSFCGDTLLTKDDYLYIYGNEKCNKGEHDKIQEYVTDNAKNTDISSTIAQNNPIFHTRMCHQKNVIHIEENDQVFKLYDTLKKHYFENLNGMFQNISKLCKYDDKSFILQHITHDELQKIEKEVKRLISLFYLKTLVDFDDLLTVALKVSKDTARNMDQIPGAIIS